MPRGRYVEVAAHERSPASFWRSNGFSDARGPGGIGSEQLAFCCSHCMRFNDTQQYVKSLA